MAMEVVGVVLNILGTILLFFFGFPQPDFDTSVGLAVEDNTPVENGLTARQYDKKIRQKMQKYKRMSYLALSLLLIGFILQLAALLI
jgi:hypothetical protein